VLDYCFQHRDEPGIKAILIYPMNALATDQAGRIAKAIWNNPKLKGQVTAGLYVGQAEKHPRKVMTEDGVITSRETQRLTPPDILLTNYKMLDYLLVRPKDFTLWKENTPESLRFLVVDELHTFDGAQGTDLACLIRRLKKRLKTPDKFLCCVGTSATLGSDAEKGGLLGYASTVFGETFDKDAVITEYRKSAGEFLEDSLIASTQLVPKDKARLLDPNQHPDYETYVRTQHELWTGQRIPDGDFNESKWRVALGETLKEHLLFQNLLKALGGVACTYSHVFERLEKVTAELREADSDYRTNLLNSLLCLVSEARSFVEKDDGTTVVAPFLQVRLQLWLREMRRMVAQVKEEPRLCFSDDLNERQLRTHLPVVHCRECGSMGWAGTKRQHDANVSSDLQAFYISFFGHSPNVVFLFPEQAEDLTDPINGVPAKLCPKCLHLSVNTEHDGCTSCGAREVIDVQWPESRIKRKGRFVGTHDCPFCGSANGLTIVGSRAASLSAVLVAQLYASGYNDDKKLLTFSDSVQDAAHRAGFFTARTYKFNFRAALQQFVIDKGDGLSLAELPDAFCDYWQARLSDPLAFVSTFLAPSMAWFRDYDHLQKHGTLPEGSKLIQDVKRRIDWEITTEYGFNSRIGRTLEKTSSSVLHIDERRLDDVMATLHEPLRNEIGPLRELDLPSLGRFLLGVITHLRVQGGILHRVLEDYAEQWGNTWRINKIPWMPNIGPYARAPVFLTNRGGSRFDVLLSPSPKHRTWYQTWAEKCFDHLDVTISAETEQLYQLVLKALTEAEILDQRAARGNIVWSIRPDVLKVSAQVVQFRCKRCGHNVSAAATEQDAWEDAACLRFHCGGHYVAEPPREDYYGKLYASGDVERIFASEHTGLLKREEREELERQFKAGRGDRRPWYPNLLSCTPTLELGIDIGDLSSLILCSVPPAQANYLQRIGRTGRRDGNSLNLTVANARAHDLFFFAEPREMLAGHVESPGVFLEAPAVLERQFTAYCFDRWVESGVAATAVPNRISQVLGNLEPVDHKKFPHSLLRFIELHRTELFDQFVAIFNIAPGSFAGEHLERFVKGDRANQGSLAYNILDALHCLLLERKSLDNKIKLLTSRIKKKVNETAKDQNHAEEVANLKREKSALQSLAVSLSNRDVFNFFTDEGLLPNYAFPEAGVVLKSVIFRRRETQEEGESKYETWIYEYERPAAAAIAELAPANHFYAEGRKVQIDQVNMTLSKVETWRLCRECSYSELVGAKEPKSSCPRCGDTLWSDEGQKKQMLRMRQVFATTSDRVSRIGDDSDDREPSFYNKQMLVDFEPKHTKKAYKVDSEDLPFGFEFLSKVTLREINFGEKGERGNNVTIAGLEMPRKGFLVCRHCGKVQDDPQKPKHAYTCTARDQSAPKHVTDCVYLYREFTSEAIRILLPITTFAGSDRMLHSFVAALHLGLKKRFQGNIDHLQTTVYEEPVPESTYRRRYLVLFDTVPGGTGYLKQLMLSESELLEIFDQALAALRACSCNQDQSKDGCYRCLYAYRRSYDMKETSRNTAVELLADILKQRDALVETKSLSDISVNALFDSVLEAQFVEALRRARRDDLEITLTKEVVNGKPGYFFRAGQRTYNIEPQVSFGADEGVGIPSRADFVFWPVASRTAAKPIAVFTDGFAWHKNRIGTDMAQRMALAQTGRYHVWSLTWKDVESAFKSQGSYFNDYLNGNAQFGRFAENYGAQSLEAANHESSLAWLLRFLGNPDAELWQSYAFVHGLMQLDAALFSTPAAKEKWAGVLKESLPAPLAEAVAESAGDAIYGLLEKHGQGARKHLRLFTSVDQSAVGPGTKTGLRIGCHLCDTPEARDRKDFEEIWTGFLRLYNLFQFLPHVLFVTTSGMVEGSYEDLSLNKPDEAAGAQTGPDEWAEIKEFTDPDLHSLLDLLGRAGWPLPEIPTFELTDVAGEIIGEAELGWPQLKVAFLVEEEIKYTSQFEHAGWRVVSLQDVLADPEAHVGLKDQRSE
jgi:DEAD/DEAH box helicase domain-containing protein